MNYCHWILLKKYRFNEDAKELAEAVRTALATQHLPEYFDSFTLASGGAENFSWNGLAGLMT